jgi:hypothetical protein
VYFSFIHLFILYSFPFVSYRPVVYLAATAAEAEVDTAAAAVVEDDVL